MEEFIIYGIGTLLGISVAIYPFIRQNKPEGQISIIGLLISLLGLIFAFQALLFLFMSNGFLAARWYGISNLIVISFVLACYYFITSKYEVSVMPKNKKKRKK